MEVPENAVSDDPLALPDDDQSIRDSIAQYTQQQLQKQNSALQAHIAAAAQKDPDVIAEAQKLGMSVGVGADVASRNLQLVRRMATVQGVAEMNLPQTAPKLSKMLEDPQFSGVAYDDVANLTRIEQHADGMQGGPGARAWAETQSAAGNINRSFFGAFKPFIDAGGALIQLGLETPTPLMYGLTGLDPNWQMMQNVWTRPRTFKVQQWTNAIQDWLSQGVIDEQPEYQVDTATKEAMKNPSYRWWGRGLANAVEQVPGALAAFALTGKLGGVAAGSGSEAEGITGAVSPGAAVESQSVPAVLGTEAAQNTYAQARAKGADQETAIVAALASGLTNYTLMGKMPASVPVTTMRGAIGQWAGRSAAMGATMTAADNAIARGYDSNRGLMDGWQQSVATMAAFEGVGLIDHVRGMTDAVEQSKLRARSPEKFQEALGKIFEGDESLRIPAEDFVNYFHDKQLDPAAMANQVGVTNLEEAAAAGTDLEIPKANFLGKLDPEHQKGLLPDIVDPATEMTARQAQAGRAELEQWIADGGVQKLQAEYAQADAETQATPEWQNVYSDLKQRYVDAGETESAAQNYATLQANAITNLARKAGMKPDELLALHNPKIVAGEDVQAGQALHQEAINNIRTIVEASKQPGHAKEKATIAPAESWLVDEAKEHGLDLAGHSHVIDGSAVRHVVNRHGNDQIETSRGQIAVTDEDFERIPELISSPDAVVFGTKTRGKRDQIGYIKQLEDGSTLYLEEVRTGKKELAAVSMRKYPATKDFDSIAATLPSNARGDGGNEPIVVRNPNAGKSEPLYQTTPEETGLQSMLSKMSSAGLNQEAPSESKRGWFRVLPDGRVEIGKTKIGDLSTFVHEPAHAYLELFRNLTQRAGASEPLKDDFDKICGWLGTTPEEAYKNGFTREQHEQWARANEQYVREGKAPTPGLRRAFHNFAVWLGLIYRRADALGVELNGDIRGVMDRLYAGEDAVNRAEQESGRQLFDNPEDAGWTEAEYRNYADAKGIEVDKAREQVQAELNEAAVRERTQEWREEKSNVRDAMTEQVDARPEYRAIRSLRRGRLDDGTELTLSRDALIKQFGEARVSALQQLHRGLYRNEGGTDAETAAELLGFNSGDEMMRALESAPRRAQAIEAGTRDAMTARHGDVRYDGSLDDKARLAVENGERAKNLHRELAALKAKVATLEKKAADSKTALRAIKMLPLEQYQEAARQIVDAKTIADLQPYRYLNASRRFSREAFDALRKGDVKGAADAKNKELLNHFLFREASAASDYVDKFESYAKRVQSRGIQQRLGLADENVKRDGGVGDFRDQFNWLLARYRLGAADRAPERSLREWADDVFGQGNEVAIAPDILNEGRFVDYRNAPISEIRELHDALVNIRHLAQQQFKMFVQGKQVDFAEAKNTMIEAARTNLKAKPEKVFEENRSVAERFAGRLHWIDSRLMRMERLIEWLDGGKSGPWHDNIWNLASDAQGDEYKLQEQVTQQVTDALADMPTEMRRRLWTEKLNVEGIPEPLPRRRLLSMAFNMGNEGNLDRLRKTFQSFGWDPDAIQRIGGMLTREEWQFVQKAWESLKPLGERMKELEKRLTGLPPAMVKVTPFKVALEDGTEMELDGGYFPIAMDPRFSERAIQQDAKETAQNTMQSGYVRATTAKGYTKARTGFGGPLLLDYEQVLTSHVAKVAKDLSHREFMLSSQRLLLDTEVRRALRETLGPAYEQQFMPWLRTIINDNNGSVQERLDGLKEGMQKLRGNIVAASLGFNASTSLLQISHAPRMLLYARAGSLAQAFVDLLAHPIENAREVRELSPNEMRFRGDNLDRDIRAVLQNPSYHAGYTRKVAVAARFALEVMDHLLSHTLWKAAYRDALDKYVDLPIGEAHEKAAHEADGAVRLGLGTSAPKDLPAIMRSNEFNKFITTLYGFHNGVYNQLRDIGHQVRYDRNLGKMTYAGILTVVLPAVLGNLLTGRGPKDDEGLGEWAAKKSLIFAADTVPLLRSVASAMEGGHDVQFSPVESVLQKGTKALMEATSDKDDKDWLGIGLDAGEAAGLIAGVPGAHQAVKTLRYMKRRSEGKVENPNPWNAVVGGGR